MYSFLIFKNYNSWSWIFYKLFIYEWMLIWIINKINKLQLKSSSQPAKPRTSTLNVRVIEQVILLPRLISTTHSECEMNELRATCCEWPAASITSHKTLTEKSLIWSWIHDDWWLIAKIFIWIWINAKTINLFYLNSEK